MKVSKSRYERIKQDRIDTLNWIDKYPDGELLAHYKRHAAALEAILEELEVVEQLATEEVVESACQFQERMVSLYDSIVHAES